MGVPIAASVFLCLFVFSEARKTSFIMRGAIFVWCVVDVSLSVFDAVSGEWRGAQRGAGSGAQGQVLIFNIDN